MAGCEAVWAEEREWVVTAEGMGLTEASVNHRPRRRCTWGHQARECGMSGMGGRVGIVQRAVGGSSLGVQFGDADRPLGHSVLDDNPWVRFRRPADGDVIRG